MTDEHLVKGSIERKSMGGFLGLLLALCIGLVPVNKFPSGGFQIVDPLMVILIAATPFMTPLSQPLKKLIFSLLPFIIWAAIINFGYYAFFQEMRNLKLFLNMLYVFFLLYAFTRVFYETLYNGNINYIYFGLFISLICVFTVTGWYEWEGARFSYSFNNPNQLALYTMILLAMVILLMQYRVDHNINNKMYYVFDIIVIIIAHYLLFKAISRSALAGTIFVDLCLIKKMFSKQLFIPISATIMIAVSLLLLINPTFLQERLAARNPSSMTEEAIPRRIDSMILKPMELLSGIKILIGTGIHHDVEGGPLKGVGGMKDFPEVHNMLGHVLWTYGIIGLGLYLYWLVNMIRKGWFLSDTRWIWAAIFTYGMGGVVYRFRSYWILLGLMLALISLNTSLRDGNLVAKNKNAKEIK